MAHSLRFLREITIATLEFSKSQLAHLQPTSSTLEILDVDYRSAIRRIRDTLAKYYFVGDPSSLPSRGTRK